jgi:hypothetical protein
VFRRPDPLASLQLLVPSAQTVEDYLAGLPDDRRQVIDAVVDLVRRSMPPGYVESVAFGMITWSVPLERYPKTYNKQPLAYLALAAQKSFCSLYLMSLYSGSDDERSFRDRWIAGGRRLDMGKSCLRFKSLDDLDLDLLGETIAATPVDAYIDRYEHTRA